MADHPCAYCGEAFEYQVGQLEQFPFCTKRCRVLDLARWMNEEYSISHPVGPEDAESLAAFSELEESGRSD